MSVQRLLEQYVFACFGAPGARGGGGEDAGEEREVYEAAANVEERNDRAQRGDSRGERVRKERKKEESERCRAVREACVRVIERCNAVDGLEAGQEVVELLVEAMERIGDEEGKYYVLERILSGERKKISEELGSSGPRRNAATLTLYQVLVEHGLRLEERKDVCTVMRDMPASALGDEHSMNASRVFVNIVKDTRRAMSTRSRKYLDSAAEPEAAQMVAAAIGEKALAGASELLPMGSSNRAEAVAALCQTLEHPMARISLGTAVAMGWCGVNSADECSVSQQLLLGAQLSVQTDVRAEQLKVLFPAHLLEATP